ncbi:hypothetical protein ABW19_dt0206111 [Dactylella cylindrospora]|nr:hypothetical protein ABW19_dt0206111 [Dactylella cylindrospora]
MTDSKPEEKPVEATPEVSETAEEKPVEDAETKSASDEKESDKKSRVGIISDASVLPESDDPKEIVKQIEFYFADSNLRWDKFLYGLVGEENKWVDIALVAGFNRMRRFKSLDNIKKALEDSVLMEMNEDRTKMRRKNPMIMMKDPKLVDKAIQRSVYAKGFGIETKTTQFDIEKFFEETGLQINAVRLRRDDEKVFKGSVFVEFKTIEYMEKFMDLENKPKWNEQSMALIDPTAEDDAESTEKDQPSTADKASKEAEKGIQYMKKEDFVEMKMKGIRDGKIKPKNYDNSNKFDAFKKNSDSHRGDRRSGKNNNNRGGRRDGKRHRSRSPRRDDRDWRERRDEDRKNGFRDNKGGRGGRQGGRDGRDGRDGDRKRASSPKFRPDGVPIVKTGTDSTAEKKNGVKRTRDEAEGTVERAESPKRAKTETTA